LNATTQIFSFTGKHALDVCLSSATTIATSLDRLQSLGTCAVPQVCSVALASFTLMMVSHFDRSEKKTAGTPVVQTRCEEGVGTTVRVLESSSAEFEFIGRLRGMSFCLFD
jgi:hypothetical protein